MWNYWIKERGTVPPLWCPVDVEKYAVVIGMNVIADEPPGTDIGEFWFDDEGQLQRELHHSPTAGDVS